LHDAPPSRRRSTNETQSKHKLLEHASLEGTPYVFKESVCDAITKVTVKTDGITSLKAAVTMDFPQHGLVDCLMGLAIHPSKVEYFAKALFNVQLQLVGGLRSVSEDDCYISQDEGKVSQDEIEINLRGVPDKAIVDELGSGVFEGIRGCRMRTVELQQRKGSTQCVSMIIARSPDRGAVINISLGLEEGTRIAEKLYTKM
jgi:hypothetical protein